MAKLAEQAERYDEVIYPCIARLRCRSPRASGWGRGALPHKTMSEGVKNGVFLHTGRSCTVPPPHSPTARRPYLASLLGAAAVWHEGRGGGSGGGAGVTLP